ncbi:protein FAM184A-like isoform X2 [Agrilus planipennis]|uniref:Protein FAM184A-like isoform X2 n=1 Tax=Agrilus planipennis TaxID=224129 RepID=A0A1W4XG56_AGRPL|nr:protein FAM184A-like isoform X2 [Agrilus planipennis]
MFNFFKRIRKEPDNNSNGKKNKDKNGNVSKEVQPDTDGDLSKNNSHQKAQSGERHQAYVTQSGLLHETSDCSVSVENEQKITKTIETDPDASDMEVPAKTTPESAVNVHTTPFSYASILKTPEKKISHSVKPCGHGTLAVSPRIPVQYGKRNDIKTPPPSPELGVRPKFSRSSSKDDNSGQSDSEGGKSETRAKIKDDGRDTVTGVMRVRFDLPKCQVSADAGGVLEDNKKNLINQEAKFQCQLNDLSKQLSLRDAEVSKLRFQIEELQRDVFAKSAGMDRLQAELQSANKESDAAKQRLKHLEEDLQTSRQKFTELAEQLTQKTDSFSDFQGSANDKIAELQHSIRELNNKIDSLESQIEVLEKEKEILEKQKSELIEKMKEEKKNFDEALAKVVREKTEIEEKWTIEFEKIRTVNIVKEQELLDDFEWKLREIEQTCKKRLQEKDKKIEEQLREACKEAEVKLRDAEKMMEEVASLKSYEVEVQNLRGLTEEQKKSLTMMLDQQEELKVADQRLKDETKRLRKIVDMEKENLQHMQRVHNQEMLEKERKLQIKLEEAKTEIATYWESRLLHECGRLKSELEQIYLEEKQAAIESVKARKELELQEAKKNWEKKLNEVVKEVENLNRSLESKETHFRNEMERLQSKKDSDIMELRRIMDKIDMTHHERFEKMVQEHEEEIERINAEHERNVKEIEANWQLQVNSMGSKLDLIKEQMEYEAQLKVQDLIDQHRADLDKQWENLVHQKDEAIRLVEDEYLTKYKQLEEQFYTQQKSHSSREVELLKTIDSLKNEIMSKNSTIDDLQNNVEVLEGGVQVLNQEVASQNDKFAKYKTDLEHRVKCVKGVSRDTTQLIILYTLVSWLLSSSWVHFSIYLFAIIIYVFYKS